MQTELTPAAQPFAVEPTNTPQTQTLDQPNNAPAARPDLEHLLAATPVLSLECVSHAPPATVANASLTPQLAQNKARSRGRIARLPKLQRDMVNRMLDNGIPYKNVAAALEAAGFQVLERNISTWATGPGYHEWRLQQDLVLENRLAQDHLVDHLRRDDASEISEVGLQAAATRLSQLLLHKAARAENVEANLDSFSQMVDLLSRLNREIGLLQKQRDDSRRTLGPAFDAARIKNEDQCSAQQIEREFSEDDPEAGLGAPPEPPLLPPVPTSTTLEIKELTEKTRRARERAEFMKTLLAGARANGAAASSTGEPAPGATS